MGHLPVFLLLQWLLRIPIVWGSVLACSLYFAGYEYTHYLMHAPAGRFVERFRWFRSIREHHRLHYDHMRRNYNVLIPLTDAFLGTLVTSKDADLRLPRCRRHGRRLGRSRRA
jgi:sterol desaturase/sphingolipid hydroxylase (fatty acid hydroxylase superfamily)